MISTWAVWLLIAIGFLGGLFSGIILHGLLIERRHECMPHDPKRCNKYQLHQPLPGDPQ